jgi:hypothetical protein
MPHASLLSPEDFDLLGPVRLLGNNPSWIRYDHQSNGQGKGVCRTLKFAVLGTRQARASKTNAASGTFFCGLGGI